MTLPGLTLRTRTLRIVTLACVTALALSTPGLAEDVTVGDIQIGSPFARASTPAARAGAVFMTLTNTGATADRLIAADGDVAARIELHEHVMNDGMMMMQEIDGGIAVPAGETTTLQPGGLHVMLMGLSGQLVEGESFQLTLEFQEAGKVDITVPIQSRTAGAGGGMGHGHQSHDHQGHNHGQAPSQQN